MTSKLTGVGQIAQRKKEIKKMGFKAITVEQIPQTVRVSKPAVTVTGNGRIILSTALAKQLGALEGFTFGVDGKRLLLMAEKAKPTDGKVYFAKATKAKKGFQVAVSVSGLLTNIGYDFKKAGNQTYEPFSVKDNKVIVVLPDETPAAKPVKHRAPKKAKVAVAGAASAPVASVVAEGEDDLELEEAPVE